MDSEKIRFLYCGGESISVEFSNEISPATNNQIRSLVDCLKSNPIKGIIDIIPTYRSLLINYDCRKISGDKLVKAIKKHIDKCNTGSDNKKRIFVVPVCYEGEFAPDMKNVCDHNKLTPEEVISIHTSSDYLIYMLGFLPGFPYLGGLDERIHTPRLESPRTSISEGSVGIGGKQTGIYPMASPGGWQLIGKTPIKVYDSKRENPIPYNTGDYIRFKPISSEEFYSIKALVESDKYEFEIVEE